MQHGRVRSTAYGMIHNDIIAFAWETQAHDEPPIPISPEGGGIDPRSPDSNWFD